MPLKQTPHDTARTEIVMPSQPRVGLETLLAILQREASVNEDSRVGFKRTQSSQQPQGPLDFQ